jgi:quinol monooxygenase YgiN
MSEPIVSIDTSLIHEGKLEEVKRAIDEMVEFVRANEGDPLAYNVYLDEDGTQMTVLQVHPHSASMELHMEVAAPAFSRFKGLITLSAIDMYGRPSEKLLEQMRRKAQMLGDASLGVHEIHAGFTRLGGMEER